MGDEMMDSRTVKFRKAMLYVDTVGLTREDRIGLAEMILRRDVDSWKTLTEPELDRLLDAFEGFALITHALTSAVNG